MGSQRWLRGTDLIIEQIRVAMGMELSFTQEGCGDQRTRD